MNEIATIVERARGQFDAVIVDRSITFDREAAFAIQVLMASDFAMGIALRNPQSVINAVSNIAAIGLTLNPARKQAYLVPRDGRIVLDISYMGLLDIAIQSGSIMWGQAEVVHAADTFELRGFDEPPMHTRNPFATDRGDVVGCYVVVKTHTGDFLTTPMMIGDILQIRDRSDYWKKKQAGPWKTDFGEMAKKTVIKRAYKTWPKTEKDRIGQAVHHLNTEADEGLPAIENEILDQPRYLGLSVERAKVVRAAAGEALAAYNVGDEWACYEAVCWIDDNDEKEALWKALQVHSDVRSCIKRMSREQDDRQKKIDASATKDEDLVRALQTSIDNAAAGRPADTPPA